MRNMHPVQFKMPVELKDVLDDIVYEKDNSYKYVSEIIRVGIYKLLKAEFPKKAKQFDKELDIYTNKTLPKSH